MSSPGRGLHGHHVGQPQIYTEEWINNEADLMLAFFTEREDALLIKEFSSYRGYGSQMITDFAKRNKKFGCTCRVVKDILEGRIYKQGMAGKYNARLTQFGLNCNHGWIEKTHATVAGDVENPLSVMLSDITGQTKDLVSNEAKVEESSAGE